MCFSLKKPIYKVEQVTKAQLSYEVDLKNNNILQFVFTIDNKSDFPVTFSYINLHYTIFLDNGKSFNGRYVKYRLYIDIAIDEKKDYIVSIDLKNQFNLNIEEKVKKITYWGDMSIQFPMRIYRYKRVKPIEGVKEF